MKSGLSAGFVFSGMLFDMTLGMLIGMAASLVVMKVIKAIKQKRKLDRLLREIAEDRKNIKYEKS